MPLFVVRCTLSVVRCRYVAEEPVKKTFSTYICLLLLGTIGSAVQQRDAGQPPASEFFGVWSGTWDGAGTGGFELTLEGGTDGAPRGGVSVTGEPTYKATLRTVAFEGRKMKAGYDFPPDDRLEIVLEATFDGDSVKGTWSARGKAAGDEIATGTWMAARKK
jgi:hypothetical protein